MNGCVLFKSTSVPRRIYTNLISYIRYQNLLSREVRLHNFVALKESLILNFCELSVFVVRVLLFLFLLMSLFCFAVFGRLLSLLLFVHSHRNAVVSLNKEMQNKLRTKFNHFNTNDTICEIMYGCVYACVCVCVCRLYNMMHLC